MNILPSDDPILDALLAEGDSHHAPDIPPDKQNRATGESRQINRQLSASTQRVDLDDREVLPHLRDGIAEALLPRGSRKQILTPRAMTELGFEKSKGKYRTEMYWRVRRHVGKIGYRLIHDLMKAGHEKPDPSDIAAALTEYVYESMPQHIIVRAPGDGQLTEFQEWALVQDRGVRHLVVAITLVSMKRWNPEYFKIQAERGAIGGSRGNGRPRTYGEAELDLVAQNMEMTVAQQVRLFKGKYKPRTVERMRSDVRVLQQQPTAHVEPTITTKQEEHGTRQLTASEERRASQQWHRERRELDPRAVAEWQREQAERAAQREEAESTHSAFMARIRQPSSRPIVEDWSELLEV